MCWLAVIILGLFVAKFLKSDRRFVSVVKNAEVELTFAAAGWDNA